MKFYSWRCVVGSVIVLSSIFYSCNSGKEESSTTTSAPTEMPATTQTSATTEIATTTDAAATTNISPATVAPTVTDAAPTTRDAVPTTTDATPATTNNTPQKGRNATLGYSHPKRMYRHESRNVNVYVSITNKESAVKDTIKAIIEEQSSDDPDSTYIGVRNVTLYKTLTITLIDPAGDFTITPIHNDSTQIIDTINGNRWRWSITTATDKKVTELILKAVAKKEDGTEDPFKDYTIHIQIRIERNVVRRFLSYLIDNPEVSVPILVSLVGFLGWYIRRKIEQKKA